MAALLATSSPDAGNGDLVFDQRAFELKNMSRKKFGLKPLSQHEYADLQIQVRAMETEQALKAEELRQSPAAAATSDQAVSSSATARQQQQQKYLGWQRPWCPGPGLQGARGPNPKTKTQNKTRTVRRTRERRTNSKKNEFFRNS